MAQSEKVGVFVVTLRTTGRDDVAWIARVASTLDVEANPLPLPARRAATFDSERLVSDLRTWLRGFEAQRDGDGTATLRDQTHPHHSPAEVE